MTWDSFFLFFSIKIDPKKTQKWKKICKKKDQVSRPGLYKRILLVQKQPRATKYSTSALLDFLFLYLLSLVSIWTPGKCDQVQPRERSWMKKATRSEAREE